MHQDSAALNKSGHNQPLQRRVAATLLHAPQVNPSVPEVNTPPDSMQGSSKSGLAKKAQPVSDMVWFKKNLSSLITLTTRESLGSRGAHSALFSAGVIERHVREQITPCKNCRATKALFLDLGFVWIDGCARYGRFMRTHPRCEKCK